MIEITLQSTLAFGLAAAANALLRRTSAAQRHAMWMLAFISVPILWLVPHLPIAVIPAIPISVAGSAKAIGSIGMGSRSTDYLTMVWFTGTVALLLRLAFSFISIRYGRSEVTTPLTVGVFRPKVRLPESSANWPAALHRSVILHEEAHIRRRDTLAHLFAQVVCAVIWFQPLAWYAARRAAEERERACDDLVLADGVDAVLYAGHLVDVARESVTAPAAAVAMARTSSLEARLRAITDGSAPRTLLTARWRVALIASLACAVFGISTLQAQDSDRVYKSGDAGVVLPKLIHQVAPKYSQSAQDQGITGAVTLACEVDKEGKPRNISVAEGVEEGLDRNAVEALREFRFDPATLEGKPVVFAVRITIRFRLE